MSLLKIISFDLKGDFASFTDPSITTNQTVYYIPSKSAIIGLLGALIGVERDMVNYEWYSDKFCELLSVTNIGLSLESDPSKFTYFSNNVSLKETKKKPFKRDVLLKPEYKVYVETSSFYTKWIRDVLNARDFAYSPYLGHAYCHARIENCKEVHASSIDNPVGKSTSSVILDESESYNPNFNFIVEPTTGDSRIIVERHLHHFVQENESCLLLKRALKHWIPIANSEYKIIEDDDRDLSKFVETEGKVVCLF